MDTSNQDQKALEDYTDYTETLREQRDELLDLLVEAGGAIASLPAGALGYDTNGADCWPIGYELTAAINAALKKAGR